MARTEPYGVATQPVWPESARLQRLRLERVAEFLLVIPILSIGGLAILLPTVLAIFYAFTNWTPGSESPWVGLKNFTDLAMSGNFHQVLINEGVLLLGLPLWVIAPLVVATFLQERVIGAAIFRTIFFLPATLAPALLGILFSIMLRPTGLINAALRTVELGFLAQDWLGNPNLVKPVLVVILLWAHFGTGVIVFSAALTSLPPELFEAAEIDGASWLQRFRYIVVPSVRHIVELWTVILVISAFVGVFPWIFTLTRGGPGYASMTMDFDIYTRGLTFGQFGLAAAEAVYLLIIMLVLTGIGRLLVSRDEST